MAESIARGDASDVIEPSSAGLYPLGRISEQTAEALLANGYSTEGLSSKPLNRHALETADVVINISGISLDRWSYSPVDSDAGRRSGQTLEEWDVEDPYGADPATYQKILQEIESRVRQLAGRLRADRRVAKNRGATS
jgi:protein-tyrosine-phosphatase